MSYGGYTPSSPQQDPLYKGPQVAPVVATDSNGNPMPDSNPWKSLLGANGMLPNNLQLATPKSVTAAQVAAGQLKSGGTLGVNQLTGNYGNVGVNSMLGDAQSRLDAVQADPTAMNLLRQKATQQGPSDWANLQHQNLALQQTDALDTSAKTTQGAMTNAMGQLAMRGGMSSGAGERAARAGAMDQAMAAQGIRRGGQQDSLNVDISDEAQKNQLLQAMPAEELAWMQPALDKANSLNSLQSDQQGRQLTADMSNRDANLQKDTYNTNATTDASKFNITNTQDVNKTNIANNLNASQINASNGLNANEFNSSAAQDASKFNLGNTLAENDAGRQNDLANYQSKLAAWASGKTADAQGSGGKK